jgi:hypothetical protein
MTKLEELKKNLNKPQAVAMGGGGGGNDKK